MTVAPVSIANGPSRWPEFKIFVPLVAAAALVTAAVWFGSKPSVPPPAADAAIAIVPRVLGDRLPSWNDVGVKREILRFVDAVTQEGTATYVPVPERVAVFDHDGTLVCEKPVVHGMFLLDRIRAQSENRPEIAHEEPYTTLLAGDIEAVRKLGKKYFMDLTFSTLAGVSEDRLESDVREFLKTAKHPVFDVPYGDVTYQPMRELIGLLRSAQFTVWICSGSGVHFMRPAAEAWYAIGPEHVIASRAASALREAPTDSHGAEAGGVEGVSSLNQRLELVVQPTLEVFNDQDRKPVSIAEHIGRRPIFAAGNVGSEGDIAMLRWSQSSQHPNLQVLVLHDDDTREMAYGEKSNASLKAAEHYGWQVVRMATDWNRMFATELVRKEKAPQSVAVPRDRWESEIVAYETFERDQPSVPDGFCFLGSSNIRLWHTLSSDFPGINVINRGVGGACLAEVAEFAPRLVAPVKPSVIVVSAGTNDVAAGATAEDVQKAFARLIQNVRRDLPDVKIVFLSIAPSIARWDQVDRQREANRAVQAFVESGQAEGVSFIDTSSAFLGSDGKPAPECFLDDLQHPSTICNGRRAAIVRASALFMGPVGSAL